MKYDGVKKSRAEALLIPNNVLGEVARLTGLEPATPGVTGRYSNQLSYNRAFHDASKFRFPSGAVDGARTRDPRRDRPVL